MILGENGTKKILNGRNPYYEMFDDIMDYLEPLGEVFNKGMEDIKNRFIEKYKVKDIEELNTLKEDE